LNWYMINDAPTSIAVPMLIVYILGMIYMMIALSIICDEYFVPSLEVITDFLGVSPDVAGATLMAAGGSAPELFTSMIGTFQESDIGFGTIVGSAVFNVLFVIGCCAIFSKEVLSLTWWPIARDFSYYILSLGVLGIFFGVMSEKAIELHESLILISMYLGYVIMMMYNIELRDLLLKCVGKYENKQMHARASVLVSKAADKHPSTFRTGVLRMMIQGKSIWKTVPYRIVTEIEGNMKETWDKIDKDGSGFVDMAELAQLEKSMNVDWDVKRVFEIMDEDHDGEVTWKEFQKMYLKSEHRIDDEMKYMWDHFDTDKDGYLTPIEAESMLRYVGAEQNIDGEDLDVSLASKDALRSFGPGDIKLAVDQIASGGSDISFNAFQRWYKQQLFYEKKLEEAEEAADHHATSLKDLLHWPSEASCFGKFWYILVLPLMVILFITIPDTRQPEKQKWAFLSFFLSISWIGVFSVIMVDFATIIGDYAGIPSVVMGLTFLAAGTSVPDLLTSVIVAQRGHGDMAVSSSVGSNIFDILIGLPVPWALYSLVKGHDVCVNADNIFLSILILIGMLVCVLGTIVCSKWRMTKTLGYTMFMFYIIFLARDLYATFKDYEC